MRVADVFINLPAKSLAKSFSYIVPEKLDFIAAGWRVLVPFGGRQAEGFVISVGEADVEGLKAIADIVDTEPWFTDHMLAVAAWISDYYLCTPAEAMRLFIPGKAGVKFSKLYKAIEDCRTKHSLASCTPLQRNLYKDLLAGGPLTLAQIMARYGKDVSAQLRGLKALALIVDETVAKRTARHQFQTFWRLAVSREEAFSFQAELKRKPAQSRLLEILLEREKLTPADISLLKINKSSLKSLLDAGIVISGRTQVLRDSYAHSGRVDKEVVLTQEQQQVLAQLMPGMAAAEYGSFLLFGVTGSGKTQVYIEAAAKTRSLGRQVVVLVPEIALTSQIVKRFKERFGDDVVVFHSKLSVGERFDTTQRLRSGTAGIVIGARSAVFAPVPDPGLFIIDEEHEFTYKQEEVPHYHTRLVADKRARLAGGTVLLGSATPAVETYYGALNGVHQLLRMPSRVDGALLPEVTVVDMRLELKEGRRTVISESLRELLTDTLEHGEQAIILLNRRGHSTFVICRECGHVMKCRHCAVSLVYHVNGNVLRCHYCQAREPVPNVCPACDGHYIRYFGTGTQKAEQELAVTFPQARIIRMDQDTTGGKMAHDRILGEFAAGNYDILLGTQMVAKGHDISNVTAVGIISADTALNLPDFRAAERTFALLTQAAGRAGRGSKAGRVVVQTYNPEHYAVDTGAKHDYEEFFRQEIEFRRALEYPPFVRFIKLTIQGGDEIKTRSLAEEAASILNLRLQGVGKVIGPFAAPVSRINDYYRMHVIIKTVDIAATNVLLRKQEIIARRGIAVDVDPINVL